MKGARLLLAALCLLIAIGASTALADDTVPSAQEAASFIPSWTSQEGLEAAIQESDPAIFAGPETDPSAAEALPHEDLDREEAIDLLTAVFGASLGGPARLYDELDVRSFRSDYVAVTEADEPAQATGEEASEPGLLTSFLPLRAEGDDGVKAPVELGLEHAEGELQPENPLVEVGLPAQIEDGISLPETGVTIELAGAPGERSASNVEESAAVYPNIFTDSDLAVTPTPTGVETFTQLRSPDAPHTQTFRLDMPPGAELEPTEDGGASVVKDGSPLLKVRPPTAIDAEGDTVPVSLSVSGDSIIVHAAPTTANEYPLLVDPVYETYFWDQNPTDHSPEWYPATSPTPKFMAYWPEPPSPPGIKMWSGLGAITPGYQANWNYYVPRFFSDFADPLVKARPTSYIKQMTMSDLIFNFNGTQPHPFVMMGLWSENKGQWVSVATRDGTQGPLTNPNSQYVFVNPNEVTDAKNGGIALATVESTLADIRTVSVGMATVEISDKDSPAFGSLGSVSGWANEQPIAPISYKVSDPGLGVYQLQLEQPQATGGNGQVITSAQCLGSARSPCPRTLESSQRPLNYDPKVMPQGENWLKITVADPVSHQSSISEARVKVDHTKPSLALSGTLTEQAKVGTTASQYTLKYDAADGESIAAAAVAPFGTAGTGEGKVQRPMGVAIDASGNVWMVDRECKCVQKYDASGKFLSQFGSPGTGNGQFSDPRAVAISATGNIWVTDLANKNAQQFNSKGEFLRKISYSQFLEPYGIAVAPGETLWISDIGRHTVYKFSENGSQPLFVVHGHAANGNPNLLTDLLSPVGLAVDAFGNVWVTDNGRGRVEAFNSTGGYITEFGSEGSGNGQLKTPVGIAIAPSGNILVVDGGNNRIEEFKPSGEYFRQFGSAGTGNAQLSEPRGLALGAGNIAYIGDAANKRIARWSHADYDPQSGVVSTEVKLDGSLVEPKYAPGCATKDCAISREWTLNADQYSVGTHSIEVIATDGVGLTTTKTLAVETHGDLMPPNIALSGAMTEQGTLGTTRPAYALKVSATDPGSAEERKSGVASTTIKVDGNVVDATSPGCPAGGCSISREWTLNSNSYSVGAHTVLVTATDAAGRVASKSLAININRDTTAPQITATSQFFTAPEGWLEQKSYIYNATGTDSKGYGATSISLKIDGALVKSKTQSCPAGDCSLSLGLNSINMAAYDGGAHPAELVVTDGAGNVAKKVWTVNVDPSGAVSTSEAEDTLEAASATGSVNTVGEAAHEPEYIGTEEDLGVSASGSDLKATGTAAPVVIETQADGGLTIEIPTVASCEIDVVEEEKRGEEELPSSEGAECNANGDIGATDLEPVAVTPTDVSSEATNNTVTVQKSAAVAANLAPQTDLITRPLYDGAMTFAAIRDAAARETYSWNVSLEDDQELKLLDAQHAAVYYDGEHLAFSITAEPAHDAVGAAVPTSLGVSEDRVLTLTVAHHGVSAEGKAFVYPIVGGAGWQGGFTTSPIAMPPPEGDPALEGMILTGRSGPPEFHGNSDSNEASISKVPSFTKVFEGEGCSPAGCWAWKQLLVGWFWYNGYEAWWRKTQPHPRCLGDGLPLYSFSLNYCNWAGPNHQKYGNGYHISAQDFFNVSTGPAGSEKHITVRMFGSGGWYPHETSEICNPTRPECA